MRRLVLINPNTSVATTAAMVEIGQDVAPQAAIQGLTAAFGAPLITDETALREAARAVLSLRTADAMQNADGIIVAAFGDPGLHALRERVGPPVTGIAEAGMAEAAAEGRRFAVVTTTPGLVAAIARRAETYGHGRSFAGTWLTSGDPVEITSDPKRLVAALGEACGRAKLEGRVDAILIGGGPLAVAARALASCLDILITEPVPAAVRLALHRAADPRI
jgi:Asp/Glu/hydantoin racemase